jgi:psp operon transcriptional activator
MAVELEWPNWPGFDGAAMAALEVHPWPGNVRELRNVVERAVYRHEDPERPIRDITFDPFQSPWAPGQPADRPADPGEADDRNEAMTTVEAASRAAPPVGLETNDLRAAVADYERALIEAALRRNRFNQKATAAALGLSYDQLRHAMKRYKLQESATA